MKTPGSPYSVAPRTRNSIASNVLPQPAPPQTSVGRPVGNPPPVISSSPRMPVGDFRKVFGADNVFVFFIVVPFSNRSHPPPEDALDHTHARSTFMGAKLVKRKTRRASLRSMGHTPVGIRFA